MEDGILKTVKAALGIGADDESFDVELIMHVNSALSILDQLGIGTTDGFFIEDDGDEWDGLLEGNPRLNLVKQYVFLKVRELFDPPATSFHLEALKTRIAEYEWRIVNRPIPSEVVSNG